ncbi:MAG: HsdR family type I site-specific deoxyribonuclease [Bacilli bacterium]
MMFNDELEFESHLIKVLSSKGWEDKVLKNQTEEDLIKNWANILFNNNREIDRLNNFPLTYGEMAQIIEQINRLRTPLKLNGFINGKTVAIKRDNPDDIAHFGKEVSLKIYDRQEIAAGQSRYQIAEQPIFPAKNKILNSRRGDLLLLINGMPVIHIELKKSGVSVTEAYHQIEKYSYEGVFTGLFSLVQVFVAMTPEETVYFANAGTGNVFNEDYFFHWADFNNERIDDWKSIASSLLSIPMAHQLIGFYTVPDDLDGVLKVMRSYQYYAANAISDKVSKIDWNDKHLLGGYIWHTTGSGKTMTSFKSAQLIASSRDADKVVFLMDRIELGTQSVIEYRGFADEGENVQDTESTYELITKLKSSNVSDTLIVTSIQKMSNIKDNGLNQNDIDIINKQKIVFIIDECHRSTFGDMLVTIKNTFSHAIFFGFTGTPILDENQRKDNTTATVFGNELHRYSIADGIRDRNVLGFDIYKILTYKDNDIRKVVALNQAKAKSEEEVFNDEAKKKVYNEFLFNKKMHGTTDELGNYEKGIEDYISSSQYRTKEHQYKVVDDILENWNTLSIGNMFSAILATSSIPEAIDYYRLFKNKNTPLKVTALFDSNIDNTDGFSIKEDGLIELITDYNNQYEQNFTIPTYSKMKKDISLRLAHKKPYNRITKNEQIDLLIVVDQMLTGFDSKWLNTLYLDKMLRYENIIQSFSRTNRLFNNIDKPFGIIKYYRKPHTMEQNIEKAVKLYSGDKPVGLFVEKLDKNILKLNNLYIEIKDVFESTDIENFEKIPETKEEKAKFASIFKEFIYTLQSANIQGFKLNEETYTFENKIIKVEFNEHIFNTLLTRYKELSIINISSDGSESLSDTTFDLSGYITSIDTGKIDSDYMNNKFEKYLRKLNQENVSKDEIDKTLDELHKSFAALSQIEQKYANIFIHDVQSGQIIIDSNKKFRDYITEYQHNAENDQITKISLTLGVDEQKLRKIMASKVTENNINEFGRFNDLLRSIDIEKSKKYFEVKCERELSNFEINVKTSKLLRKFILCDGFDIEEYIIK